MTLSWGILTTGRIARTFAEHLATSTTGRVVAVASRTEARAEAFAEEFDADRGYGDYQSLLDDPGVDAVYIATPHPMHAEWAIKAAGADKHVLCEKPLTMNHRQAVEVIDAAQRHGVFLMEAFMYRCHPQTARLRALLDESAIGDVRMIEATHSFAGSTDPRGRLLAKELGGGAILDVGCYCVSMARLVAGEEPDVVTGAGHVGATGIDEWAVGSLRFPRGTVAQLMTSVQVHQPPVVGIHGTSGSIELHAPWLPTLDGAMTTSIVVQRGGVSETVEVPADRGLYAYEADEVAACIARGEVESPAMTWDDTLGNMAVLDRWRTAVGVRYPADD